ncbi:DUF3846 domain-containing protein [Glutamicibacter ardleyensis]|uniref:DUF3846 domain-containing protein n=1 Tax=Glutamicibacter ardleyensis TaxID=225894 RepID=UPI003FD42D2A
MPQFIEGLKITVDGETHPVQIDAKDRLQGLYKALDCTTVEYLGADHSIDLITDEESKLVGKKPNLLATVIAMQLGFKFFPGDYIAGDTVLLAHDGEGETIGLDGEQRRLIESMN